MSGQARSSLRSRAASGELDPAVIDSAITNSKEELAALYAEHSEKADAADELWRQILGLEQRLNLLQEVRTAVPADHQQHQEIQAQHVKDDQR